MSPCQSCGACCATYRVSFHHEELDTEPGGRVPAGLVEALRGPLVCMRVAVGASQRCIALRGTIGESVSCAIYTHRPSPCSEFAPLAAVGRGDEACNEARRRHGLPSLMPAA